ncbi:response regulator [Paractinoplanes hotanensis]|uniref:histidine kinase n=1 Tax=Paractinoplanes hotanensis TaxID=2906497 RepID=A0ABT0Y5Z3_9ACTN|nr:response regulator [Actinoplanes hotanensis]MCM4080749.1 response regulator [Actinoplanes hotanensis]
MTAAQIEVLVVDDNDDDAVLIGHSLSRAGLPVRLTRAETSEEVTATLAGRPVDVVICDYNLPGVRAEDVLVQVREHDADLPFVLVSGQVGEEKAADLMRAGARDFVLKDRLTRLAPAVQRELHEAAERRRHRHTEQQLRQAERLDSLGQLAGGIAHDFNNILAVISGYATILNEELGPDHALHADALAIEQAAARGSGLTRQLLIFSGLEPSRPELLDLNVVATDMQRVLSRTLGDDVELTTMLSLNLPRITIDRSKLEQVIMNAAMNARAAMPSNGRLTVSTEVVRETGHVCLSIIDSGRGMPPEVAARAFEPFFTTKGRGKGTGLGLATAYGVITEAGGTISLDSRPGEGTTLRICLPPAEIAAPASTLVRRPPSTTGRILVVEDEDGVRDIVGRILRRAGYEVHAADDPVEALRLVHDGLELDALLTDIIMPGMYGTQLAAELRKIRPALPVVFMSGYTSGSAPGGEELPADAPLLHKPFQSENLLNALHTVLH